MNSAKKNNYSLSGIILSVIYIICTTIQYVVASESYTSMRIEFFIINLVVEVLLLYGFINIKHLLLTFRLINTFYVILNMHSLDIHSLVDTIINLKGSDYSFIEILTVIGPYIFEIIISLTLILMSIRFHKVTFIIGILIILFIIVFNIIPIFNVMYSLEIYNNFYDDGRYGYYILFSYSIMTLKQIPILLAWCKIHKNKLHKKSIKTEAPAAIQADIIFTEEILESLKAKYVRGEITCEEYNKKRAEIIKQL